MEPAVTPDSLPLAETLLLHAMCAAGTFYQQYGERGFTIISEENIRVSKVQDLPFPPAHCKQLAEDMRADDRYQFVGHSKDGRMHVFKVELANCVKLAQNGMDWKPSDDPVVEAITQQ